MNTTNIALNNPKIQLPLIHSNGNSGKVLGSEYFEALRSLESFKKQFYSVEFHKRDYYPLGDESWELAVKHRQEIKQKINDVHDYLELHSAHCFESA